MDLAVAVQAAATHDERIRIVTGQAVWRIGDRRVAALGMTILAEHRESPNQQCRVNRAMWVMAQQAVLAGGRMFEKIGSAQIAMTAPAQFVYGVLVKQGIVHRVMRIVAVGAGHDTKTNRVCVRLEAVRPFLAVTGITDIGLFGLDRDRVDR